MNATIKDIINKLSDGLADEKKPLLEDLTSAIEKHVEETTASERQAAAPKKEASTRELADRYQADRSTPQSLFKPPTPPDVPDVASYDNLLGKPKRLSP